MDKGLFRKKSLERIESPEQIDAYIKTVKPSSIGVILAVAAVWIGLLIWGIFGGIDLSYSAVTVCRDGRAVCFVAEDRAETVTEETRFMIDREVFCADDVSDLPYEAAAVMSAYEMHLCGYTEEDWVYAVELDVPIADGIYKTEVLTDRVSPISLLMN